MKDLIHEQYLAAQRAAASAAKEGKIHASVLHARRATFYMNLEAQVPRLLEVTGADDSLYNLNSAEPIMLEDFEDNLTDEEKVVHGQQKYLHAGSMLKSIREAKGKTQIEIANAIGVSVSFISLMETRKSTENGQKIGIFPESVRRITPKHLQVILSALEISSQDIDENPELSYLMKRTIWETQERSILKSRR